MRASVLIAALPLAACVAADAPQAVRAAQAIRVTRADGGPFAMDEGAAARRQADALCGPRGVRSSIYDRFEAGVWVFVEGCA